MPLGRLPLLGPFAVHPDGRLTPRDADTSPCFTVRWRGRLVRARLVQTGPEGGRLALRAILGRVPSSAARGEDAVRPRSFALLRALAGSLPESWRVGLTPDHRALIQTEVRLPLPVTAADLITAVTVFLLTLGPYLDFLDEDRLLPRGHERML